MYQKVLNYCKKHSLIEVNDKIVVGISGGADSVCLLTVLCEMRVTMSIQIHAVHVNHGIRIDAEKDVEYVKLLCDRLQVPLHIKYVNIPKLSKELRISTEEAGRRARYDAFEEIRVLTDSDKIAVAHNMNDQAETVLFHLFRGTGIKGMSGIRPARDHIIRPLLCVERLEIEEYLKEMGLKYQTDQSNYEDDYTRNRIRNHLIPLAEEMVCTGIVQHISETARIAFQAEEYITKQAQQIHKKISKEQKNTKQIRYEMKELQELDSILQVYLIREGIYQVLGTITDISSVHLTQIIELMDKQVGKQIMLPNGIRAYTTYDSLMIVDSKSIKTEKYSKQVCSSLFSKDNELEMMQLYEYEFEHFGKLELRLFMRDQGQIIPQNLYTKWFDYDKIKKSLQVRSRKQGDYLIVDEKGSRKSLKQYMIDEKIPREERNQLLILSDEDHVVWIPGYRISQYYKIEDQTKKILEVKLTGGI